ncbi:hypothetical protein L798_11619 [Zootermopsis nevadensis]|uniref:Uncharacterized protein n=1 Tax=Zootermopsis nevadensis TaxID=136037 RepID=A0A067QYC6_ZOONE|nr:hypothetical protein L798_11619 [Zootermopsis nevadensis]
MESFKVGTNKFLGEMFQNVFYLPLRILLYDKTTWFCGANRIMVTDAINIHVTPSRPSSAGVTSAVRGVARSLNYSASADCRLDIPHSDGDDIIIKLFLIIS